VTAKRLKLLLPCAPDAERGNGTTAQRMAVELGRRGYAVETVDVADVDLASPGEADADLLIALHAGHCGPPTRTLAEAWGIPYVVLFTGTDLNGHPSKDARAATEHAAICVALGTAAGRRARDVYPEARDRVQVIPQAVAPMPFRPGMKLPDAAPKIGSEAPMVLMIAALREVKDPLRAVTALGPMLTEHPDLQLWFVGPVLEEATGKAVEEACATHDFAHYLGPVARDHLLPILRRATLVLSTSRSEGGPPNALLEAVSTGRPVLASSIPAHREFPGAEHCFRDDAEMRKRFRKILEDPDRAAVVNRKLQEIVRQVHSPAAEGLAWDRLLRPLLV